jgi:pullulanase/glycogen debranching enzyme
LKKHQTRFLFVQKLIALRKRLPFLLATTFIKNEEIQIYNESLAKDPSGFERFVSFQILNTLWFSFNANNFSVELNLPPCKENHVWKMLIYTTNPIKTAIFDEKLGPKVEESIVLDPYTCLVAIQSPL